MKKHWLAVLSALALLQMGTAHAASVSYRMDQTNVDAGALMDGTPYAVITIDDDVPGSLRFTLNLLAPLTGIADTNFGITEFAFNVLGTNPLQDAGAVAGQWTLPTNWNANVAPPPNQADGFGRFDAAVTTTGSDRLPSLSFLINNTGLTLASFEKLSTNNAGQGNVFFSAHIAGFDGPGSVSSGYFGGSTLVPVPVPAALSLLLSGLAGLFGFTRRR